MSKIVSENATALAAATKKNTTPSSATSGASNPSNFKTQSSSNATVHNNQSQSKLPSSKAMNEKNASSFSKPASSETVDIKNNLTHPKAASSETIDVGNKTNSKTPSAKGLKPNNSFRPSSDIGGIPIAVGANNPAVQDLLKIKHLKSLNHILVPFNNESFIKGTVEKIPKRGKNKEQYKVSWNFTALGESTITEKEFYEGIHNNALINSVAKLKDLSEEENEPLPSDSRTKKLFSHCPTDELIDFCTDEDQDDVSIAEDETTENLDDIENEKEYFLLRLFHDELKEPHQDIEIIESKWECPESPEDILGLMWDTDTALNPPSWKLSKKPATLKEDDFIQSLFTTPVDSFLAFCPLLWFRKIVHETNLYASAKYTSFDGAIRVAGNLFKPLTVDEILTFHGIMIMMAVNPFPGE
jgi:hypothetical protein